MQELYADDGVLGEGWQRLQAITGQRGKQTIEELHRFSPDLCDYIVGFAFGEIYGRSGLDAKQRMIVTLTTLITQGGCDHELSVHIGSALNVGLSPHEVMEVILHCIPYVGFPRVMSAVKIVRGVFEERGIRLAE